MIQDLLLFSPLSIPTYLQAPSSERGGLQTIRMGPVCGGFRALHKLGNRCESKGPLHHLRAALGLGGRILLSLWCYSPAPVGCAGALRWGRMVVLVASRRVSRCLTVAWCLGCLWFSRISEVLCLQSDTSGASLNHLSWCLICHRFCGGCSVWVSRVFLALR